MHSEQPQSGGNKRFGKTVMTVVIVCELAIVIFLIMLGVLFAKSLYGGR